MEKVPYPDYRKFAKTGDRLSFAGAPGHPFTDLIRKTQKEAGHKRWDISHSGLLLQATDMAAELPLYADAGRVMVFESTTMNSEPDALTSVKENGVSIVPASERIASYLDNGGRVFVKPLVLADAFREAYALRFAAFVREMHGRPYERRPSQLAAAVGHFDRTFLGEHLRWLFCSELLWACDEACGLVKNVGKRDAHTICPAEVPEIDPTEYVIEVAFAQEFEVVLNG